MACQRRTATGFGSSVQKMLRPLPLLLACAGQVHGRPPMGMGTDDDGGSDSKFDMRGLEGALSSGGAQGLVQALGAMKAMHAGSEQLIPMQKDADGNLMYNFGAIDPSVDKAEKDDKKDDKKSLASPPAASALAAPAADAPLGPPAAHTDAKKPKMDQSKIEDMLKKIHDDEATADKIGKEDKATVEGATQLKNLRGGEQQQQQQPAAAVVPVKPHQAAPAAVPVASVIAAAPPAVVAAPPSVPLVAAAAPPPVAVQQASAAPAGFQSGLAGIRDSIDQLMKQTGNSMAAGQAKAEQAMQQEAQTSSTVAALANRVAVVEQGNKDMTSKVSSQAEEVKELSAEVSAEKADVQQALAAKAKLESAAAATDKKLEALEKSNGQLEAEEKVSQQKLASVEEGNKQLMESINALKEQVSKLSLVKRKRVVRRIRKKATTTTTTTVLPAKDDDDSDDDTATQTQTQALQVLGAKDSKDDDSDDDEK